MEYKVLPLEITIEHGEIITSPDFKNKEDNPICGELSLAKDLLIDQYNKVIGDLRRQKLKIKLTTAKELEYFEQ